MTIIERSITCLYGTMLTIETNDREHHEVEETDEEQLPRQNSTTPSYGNQATIGTIQLAVIVFYATSGEKSAM